MVASAKSDESPAATRPAIAGRVNVPCAVSVYTATATAAPNGRSPRATKQLGRDRQHRKRRSPARQQRGAAEGGEPEAERRDVF